MRRGGRLCPLKGSYEFAADFRISVVQFAGQKAASAPTVLWTSPGKFVGVDAHIDPAVKTVFTKIQCEFDGAPRGDVGIAPYAFLGKSNKHKNPDAVQSSLHRDFLSRPGDLNLCKPPPGGNWL